MALQRARGDPLARPGYLIQRASARRFIGEGVAGRNGPLEEGAVRREAAGAGRRLPPLRGHNSYERQRLIVTGSKFILAEGPLQNQDGVIHVKATRLQSPSDQTLEVRSYDFH